MMLFAGIFSKRVWATGLGHAAEGEVRLDNRNAYLQALQKTGATGLEPATSGVTVERHGLPLIALSRIWSHLTAFWARSGREWL